MAPFAPQRGHPITGETKAKQTKAGVKEYVYYRCTQYTKKDHPRVRLSEEDVEKHDSLAADLRRVRQDKIRRADMRLNDEIDSDAFQHKQVELREREGELQLQLEAAGREPSEVAELAVKAFELSQTLPERWVTADTTVKRQILEIVCLNWTLDDISLVPTIRKPFSVLAEGLVSADNRGDRI